jgi:hypothetical protein
VPTARVRWVPGAGHLLPDRTDAVLDVLTGSTAESRRARHPCPERRAHAPVRAGPATNEAIR